MKTTAQPPHLTEILKLITESDPVAGARYANKKIDAGDVKLGVLPPEMQRLWVAVSTLREKFTEIMDSIDDLTLCHDADHDLAGSSIPPDVCKKYVADMKELIDASTVPGVRLKILNGLFWRTLALDFPSDDSVYGIREGFVVVSRKHDTRGDGTDPLDRMKKFIRENTHLNLSGVIGVIEVLAKMISSTTSPKAAPEKAPEPTPSATTTATATTAAAATN